MIVWGIGVVLVAAMLLAWSGIIHPRQERFSIILLVFTAFILRFYTASDNYLHEWDERYHALVAKNMMAHPLKPTLYDNPVLPADFKSWVGSHIWLHKQPATLWAIMISFHLFGVNEWAVRMPSVFLSALAVWLIYSIGAMLFNRKTGWWAAFFMCIHGLTIELAAGRVATDHVDVLFACFILSAAYFVVRRPPGSIINATLIGIFIGLAILTKWLPALIVIPFWAMVHFRYFRLHADLMAREAYAITISIALIAMPWQIFIITTYPDEAAWAYAYNARHLTEVLDGRGGVWYYFIEKYRLIFGELVLLIIPFFVYRYFKRRNFILIGMLIWATVPPIFFSFASTKMQGYTVFAAPAVFLLTAYFLVIWFRLKHKLNAGVFYIVVLMIIALPIRYSLERLRIFEPNPKNKIWTDQLKSVPKQNLPLNTVIFNCPRPIEAMFYSGFTAYHFYPDNSQRATVKRLGYRIGIYHDGKVILEH